MFCAFQSFLLLGSDWWLTWTRAEPAAAFLMQVFLHRSEPAAFQRYLQGPDPVQSFPSAVGCLHGSGFHPYPEPFGYF